MRHSFGGRTSAAVGSRSRMPVSSTTRVKSAPVFSLMTEAASFLDCRIFRRVRKRGATAHQSAVWALRQIVLLVRMSAPEGYLGSRVLITGGVNPLGITDGRFHTGWVLFGLQHAHFQCPLYPDEARLFDHPISPGDQSWLDFDAERLVPWCLRSAKV